MQKILLYKLLTIGGLAILLLIPLAIIESVINERQYYRDNVIRDVAKSSAGEQSVDGAILVMPYSKKVVKKVVNKKGGSVEEVLKETQHFYKEYLLPEEMNVKAHIETKERYRGIYKIPVYQANIDIVGYFQIPSAILNKINNPDVTWGKPYIVLGIEDIRGIDRSIAIDINNHDTPLLPGTNTNFIAQGVHALLPEQQRQASRIEFSARLSLEGMSRLSFLPTGKSTQVSVSSEWPHPSFIGRYLPKMRHVDDAGFEAQWETSLFSSNMEEHFQSCVTSRQCQSFKENTFGVTLHQGVDVYVQADRSVKYALLFIGLTFVAFFLFEVLKGLPIHAMQYGLVGIALALFYFLLISLSEHIAFALAYVIAAFACVGLLGFYVTFILKSVAKGMVFGSTLSTLYGALYILVGSEDYALLMGSCLLFAILAFVMVITRNVNWYHVETSAKSATANHKDIAADNEQASRI